LLRLPTGPGHGSFPAMLQCTRTWLSPVNPRWFLSWALLAAATATRASVGASPAPSWPMFRGGSALLGLAATPLTPPLSVLWTFKTQGPVKSSAAVAGRQVFIGSEDQHLYALELATGKKLWAFQT